MADDPSATDARSSPSKVPLIVVSEEKEMAAVGGKEAVLSSPLISDEHKREELSPLTVIEPTKPRGHSQSMIVPSKSEERTRPKSGPPALRRRRSSTSIREVLMSPGFSTIARESNNDFGLTDESFTDLSKSQLMSLVGKLDDSLITQLKQDYARSKLVGKSAGPRSAPSASGTKESTPPMTLQKTDGFVLHSRAEEEKAKKKQTAGPMRVVRTSPLHTEIEQAESPLKFDLLDTLDLIYQGINVIVEDDFSQCFRREYIRPWNWNAYLFILWCIGIVIRYCILLPIRCGIMFGSIGMAVMVLTGIDQIYDRWLTDLKKKEGRWVPKKIKSKAELKKERLKAKLDAMFEGSSKSSSKSKSSEKKRAVNHNGNDDENDEKNEKDITVESEAELAMLKEREEWEQWTLKWMARGIVFSWLGVIDYKGILPKKQANQIYVANHSTMLDVVLLLQMEPFCFVGQLHASKPFVRFIQLDLLRSLRCIWFNRAEQKDRSAAVKKITDHISNPDNPRLLLFPEGTCVNNSHIVQFKKGAFGMPGVQICPISIKYHKNFGVDAYWISRERSFLMHIFDILKSWAMVATVTYLEPMKIRNGEQDFEFANRVKAEIAKSAGLVNTEWNGYLKHYRPSERLINARKKLIADQLRDSYREALERELPLMEEEEIEEAASSSASSLDSESKKDD